MGQHIWTYYNFVSLVIIHYYKTVWKQQYISVLTDNKLKVAIFAVNSYSAILDLGPVLYWNIMSSLKIVKEKPEFPNKKRSIINIITIHPSSQ